MHKRFFAQARRSGLHVQCQPYHRVAGRGREECGFAPSIFHHFHALAISLSSASILRAASKMALHICRPDTSKVSTETNHQSSNFHQKSAIYHVPTSQHHRLLHLLVIRLVCNCPPCPSKTASQTLSSIRNHLICNCGDRRTDSDQHHPRRPITLYHSRGRRS